MYIRDFPHVAVGGSVTAAGRRVVGEDISVPRARPGGTAGRLQLTPGSSENSPCSRGVSLVYV